MPGALFRAPARSTARISSGVIGCSSCLAYLDGHVGCIASLILATHVLSIGMGDLCATVILQTVEMNYVESSSWRQAI